MSITRRRLVAAIVGATAAGSMVAVMAASADGGDGGDGFRGRLTASLTTDPAVSGVNRGGLDWALKEGSARVSRDGVLRVDVEGLVFAATGTTTAPGAAAPLAAVSASVFCNGARVQQTATVPLSDPDGNARIRERVTLPAVCVAPYVFVHPGANGNTYIAFTGFRP
jgi:hypothetical protein